MAQPGSDYKVCCLSKILNLKEKRHRTLFRHLSCGMRDPGRKRRVVVADDERAIAETMAVILNTHGYEAHAVGSGEAALELVQRFHPDFLISDIRMDGMDGIEAATRIRDMCPECKVIVFSATMIDHDTRLRLRKLGFDYLRKPLHPTQLLAQLRK